jgi:hypothetical protein
VDDVKRDVTPYGPGRCTRLAAASRIE